MNFQDTSKQYQPLFKNKAIYRIVIYIKRFVRLVSFVFKEKEIVFNVFFVRVVIPKGWMVWMQDFWKLAYKKACRHDIRDEVSTRAKVFLVFVLTVNCKR